MSSEVFPICHVKQGTVGRVELYIYDDRGGVQPPTSFVVQCFRAGDWVDVEQPQMSPLRPAGSIVNAVRFRPQETRKVRVVYTNAGKAGGGVTEIEV